MGRVGEMIFDEGHRVGGRLKRASILNSWPADLPRRQLFFTATPARRKSKTESVKNFNMYADCGECIFSYNYARALRDKVCSPVEMQLFSTTEEPGPQQLDRRTWLLENIAR